MLEDIDAAKWTIASYFLLILHPEQHMFVKPTIAQHYSEECGFEINYKPQLNWLTKRQDIHNFFLNHYIKHDMLYKATEKNYYTLSVTIRVI